MKGRKPTQRTPKCGPILERLVHKRRPLRDAASVRQTLAFFDAECHTSQQMQMTKALCRYPGTAKTQRN